MQLRNRFIKVEQIAISKLQGFQGSLKSLEREQYEKLYNSIKKDGIVTPFIVWENSEGIKIEDGHQRAFVLGEMIKNRELPESTTVPCYFISCENEQEAKKAILLISSQYGKITQESLSDFFIESNLDYEILQKEAEVVEFKPIALNYSEQGVGTGSEENSPESAQGALEYISIPYLPEDIMEIRALWDEICDKLILNDKICKTPSDVFEYVLNEFKAEK